MAKTYTVTATIDGKRRYFRASTKTQAEKKKNEAIANSCSFLKTNSNATFEDLAKKWLSLYKDGKHHTRTIDTVEYVFNNHIIPVIGSCKIKDIDTWKLTELMNYYKDYSQSTQKKIIQYTKIILDMAVELNILIKSPATKNNLKVTARPPEKVEPLTDEQCSILFQATKGTRVYPFLIVLRFCGLRKGEALGLMWKDVDFDNSTIHVQRSIVYPKCNKQGVIEDEMKTSNANRFIPMNDIVKRVLLEEKKKSKSMYIFSTEKGNFLSESSFRRMWDIISYRTVGGPGNLPKPINFRVHPHQLRHTCITSWIESNMLDLSQVQALAGHSSPDITARVYTHYRKEQRKKETNTTVINMPIGFVC